jgi:hypothetical protein
MTKNLRGFRNLSLPFLKFYEINLQLYLHVLIIILWNVNVTCLYYITECLMNLLNNKVLNIFVLNVLGNNMLLLY